jgi:hypothetical protein
LIGKSRAGGRGGQARHIDIVLDREGDTPERQAIRLGVFAHQCFRGGAEGVIGDRRDEHCLVGPGGAALDNSFDDVERSCLALGIEGFESSQVSMIGSIRFPPERR